MYGNTFFSSFSPFNDSARTIPRSSKQMATNALFPPGHNLPDTDSSALTYIGGWIINKLKCECPQCNLHLLSQIRSHFIQVKTYQFAREDALVSISPMLSQTLSKWEQKFRLKIKMLCWKNSVGKSLKSNLWEFHSPKSPCNNHPQLFQNILSIFVKLRLHSFFSKLKIKDAVY